MPPPPGIAGLSLFGRLAGERPHRHAQGLRRVGAAGAGDVAAQSPQRPSVRGSRSCGTTARACASNRIRAEMSIVISSARASSKARVDRTHECQLPLTGMRGGPAARRDLEALLEPLQGTDDGQLHKLFTGGLMEMAPSVAQMTGSYLFTDLKAKWAQIEYDRGTNAEQKCGPPSPQPCKMPSFTT
jgi:hypothetical protein